MNFRLSYFLSNLTENTISKEIIIKEINFKYMRKNSISIPMPPVKPPKRTNKSELDLQPLYYKKNGKYYDAGLYIDLSEFK